jgi:hypothetical protein
VPYHIAQSKRPEACFRIPTPSRRLATVPPPKRSRTSPAAAGNPKRVHAPQRPIRNRGPIHSQNRHVNRIGFSPGGVVACSQGREALVFGQICAPSPAGARPTAYELSPHPGLSQSSVPLFQGLTALARRLGPSGAGHRLNNPGQSKTARASTHVLIKNPELCHALIQSGPGFPALPTKPRSKR